MRRADRVRRLLSFGLTGGVLPAALVAVTLPWLMGGSAYAMDVATVALLYTLFVVSWDIFSGTTGELSFGHSFFIGVAAFGAAILQSKLNVHPAIACALGTAAGGGAGCLVGLLTLRHAGVVFTMVTMAMQLMLHRTLFLWGDTFGGEEGVLVSRTLWTDLKTGYIIAAVLAVGGLAGAQWLRASRLGRELRASGGDVRIAQASGVNVTRVRIVGAGMSGLLAGLGGSLLAMHRMMANHEMAGDMLAGMIFLLAMAGGAGSLFGPWIVAVLYMSVVREKLFGLGELEPVVAFGLLLLVVWALPGGLASLGRHPRLRRWIGMIRARVKA